MAHRLMVLDHLNPRNLARAMGRDYLEKANADSRDSMDMDCGDLGNTVRDLDNSAQGCQVRDLDNSAQGS
jgi:hypothetical protein